MITLKNIRTAGEQVFYLEASGIKRGYVHKVYIRNDRIGDPFLIEYYVKHSTDGELYGGSKKSPDELYTHSADLLKYLEKHIQY